MVSGNRPADCMLSQKGKIIIDMMSSYDSDLVCESGKMLKVIDKNGRKLACCKSTGEKIKIYKSLFTKFSLL